MVRRGKNKIFRLFNNYYFIEVGWPMSIKLQDLGWKDKYGSPRFEWTPVCVWWVAPRNGFMVLAIF